MCMCMYVCLNVFIWKKCKVAGGGGGVTKLPISVDDVMNEPSGG